MTRRASAPRTWPARFATHDRAARRRDRRALARGDPRLHPRRGAVRAAEAVRGIAWPWCTWTWCARAVASGRSGSIRSELVSTAEVTPSAVVEQRLRPAHEAVRAWVGDAVGMAIAPMPAAAGRADADAAGGLDARGPAPPRGSDARRRTGLRPAAPASRPTPSTGATCSASILTRTPSAPCASPARSSGTTWSAAPGTSEWMRRAESRSTIRCRGTTSTWCAARATTSTSGSRSAAGSVTSLSGADRSRRRTASRWRSTVTGRAARAVTRWWPGRRWSTIAGSGSGSCWRRSSRRRRSTRRHRSLGVADRARGVGSSRPRDLRDRSPRRCPLPRVTPCVLRVLGTAGLHGRLDSAGALARAMDSLAAACACPTLRLDGGGAADGPRRDAGAQPAWDSRPRRWPSATSTAPPTRCRGAWPIRGSPGSRPTCSTAPRARRPAWLAPAPDARHRRASGSRSSATSRPTPSSSQPAERTARASVRRR